MNALGDRALVGMDETMNESVDGALHAAVAARLGPARYGLWFGEGVRLGIEGDAIEIGVPNTFFQEWIEGHFASSLTEAAAEVTGRSLRLSFKIEPEAESVVDAGRDETGSARVFEERARPGVVNHPAIGSRLSIGNLQSPRPAPVASPAPGKPARPLKKLDEYVTGDCNRLAHTAVGEIVRTAGGAFNPLFIHGGVGLGKTHLLEGATAALRSSRPGMNVSMMTAEGFTNAFLEAMRTGGLPNFRSRTRGLDALVIDDVHFLASKRATQEEFLHTFDALVSRGSAVIVSADHHPRQLHKLSNELITRFLAGMVVRLDAPSATTRGAILRAKGSARGVEISDTVADFVAEHLRGSVRELEGALHTLIVHANMTGRRIDLDLARSALRETIRHTSRSIGLRDVERAVCELFKIDAEALRSDSRARTHAYPRMLAMYTARRKLGVPYGEIGRYFGDRNHSTVMAAEKKVEAWLKDEGRGSLLAGFESVADVLVAIDRAIGQ
jgi:chromosomal replication initiator protein